MSSGPRILLTVSDRPLMYERVKYTATVWPPEGAQVGCFPSSHCLLCSLINLQAIEVSGKPTGASGWAVQLTCVQLQRLR